jgi:FAD/FMN-containing dehydrogenase
LDRREFLRRGLALGTVGLAAAAGSLALDACGAPTTSPPSTTLARRAPTEAAWRKLAASLRGALIRPSDPTYGADRLLYNARFTDLRPRALAYCANEDDVARCVDFTNEYAVTVCARSGGHSYAAYSSCDGLVIDVGRLAGIDLDRSGRRATIGAGAQLIDVYNTLGRRGRLLPGGSCPTVGIAGLALGGGIGVFARRYGLTCDNLQSVRLVTPGGDRVAADGSDHADLLWACRGGGGGNFGVATSFDFSVHPVPEVTLFTLQYPWAAAATLLEAWQHWTANAPDELWSSCQLESQGTYGYLAQVAGVYCGAPGALAPLLAGLHGDVGATPSYDFVGSRDYLDAMAIEAGCEGLTVAACHTAPEGVLSRAAYAAKSSYVDAPMTSRGVARAVEAVERLRSTAPTVGGALAFDAYGGAVNRVPAHASAFVHRDKLACIQATYSWSGATPAAEVAAGQSWLAWLGAEVFDPATGAYQNYIDPTLEDWANAYYGSNLARLVTVKARYDPENRFAFAQSVPLTLN